MQFAMIEFSNINSSPSVITSDSGFDAFDEKTGAILTELVEQSLGEFPLVRKVLNDVG